MHVQSMEPEKDRDKDKRAKDTYKVWLEKGGRRAFEPATRIPDGVLDQIREHVDANRESIERRWVNSIIGLGKLKLKVLPGTAILTAYPGHNSFTRTIDLTHYTPDPSDYAPENVNLDSRHCSLNLRAKEPPSEWIMIYLPDILWEG